MRLVLGLALLSAAACSATFLKHGCSSLFVKSLRSKRYEWVGVSLRFPCSTTRHIYYDTGRYVPRNSIALRFQVPALSLRKQAYVAIPRFKHGVPVTLARVVFPLKGCGCTPIFHAYPCWSMQELGDCNAIQSAIDLVLDRKKRLWVLDSGVSNTLLHPIFHCPPKVVVIDTEKHQVVRRIDLSQVAAPDSRLQYLMVDQSILGHTYLYISDAARRSILVWDVFADRGWRIVLPLEVAGLLHDVLYLALTQHKDASSVLYFTYLSSPRIYSIRTEFLRRDLEPPRIMDLGLKPVPMILLGADGGTKLYFRAQGDSFVFEWDTRSCFRPHNFEVVHEGGDCRLATHVAPGFKRVMYGLKSNFYDYIRGTTGCVGPSMELFPLLRAVDKTSKHRCKSLAPGFSDIFLNRPDFLF